MNIKKYLREKNRRDAEIILNNNRDFHDRAIAEIEENRQGERRRRAPVRRWCGVCAGVAATLCCVLIPVYITCNRDNTQPPVYYEDNRGTRDVGLSDWSDGSDMFTFSVDDSYIETNTLKYDVVSNDILVYQLKCNSADDLLMVGLWLYPNPYYRDEAQSLTEGTVVELDGYTLMYDETVSEVGGVQLYSAKGKIEAGGEMVFITYSETSLETQSNFIWFVRESVHKK